jgi:hypothetical protein
LSLYAHNLTGYPHLSTRALNIIQRWQAIVYNLSYQYDKEGVHELKQRDLRERIKQLAYSKDMSNAEEQLIKRGPNGNIIMSTSHFDFIEKPSVTVNPRQICQNNESTKFKIDKAFKMMKRKKETSVNFM